MLLVLMLSFHSYAQQMSRDEIKTFLEKSGATSLLRQTSRGQDVNDGVPEVQISLNLGAGPSAYKVPAGLHEQVCRRG